MTCASSSITVGPGSVNLDGLKRIASQAHTTLHHDESGSIGKTMAISIDGNM
jgi:hypothetical protein